jgi:hypothetical protein
MDSNRKLRQYRKQKIMGQGEEGKRRKAKDEMGEAYAEADQEKREGLAGDRTGKRSGSDRCNLTPERAARE